METMLIKYVRRSRRRPVGVVIAHANGKMGWSKCNFKAGDKWSKRTAIYEANKKLKEFYEFDLDSLPHDVKKDLKAMYKRAKKYFRWEE